MTWYAADLQRFRQERLGLEALVASSPWLEAGDWKGDDEGILSWESALHVGETRYAFSLVYPANFPKVPIMVLPQDRKSLWSRHQYGAGGELCLEWGPDNWVGSLTAVDMVHSLYRLLSDVKPDLLPGSTVPSRHYFTQGQQLALLNNRLLVPSSVGDVLANLAELESWAGRAVVNWLTVRPYDFNMMIHIKSFATSTGDVWRNVDLSEQVGQVGFEEDLTIARWPAALPLPTKIEVSQQLVDAMTEAGIAAPAMGVVVLVRNQYLDGYKIRDDGTVYNLTTINLPPPKARLDADHQALGAKKVGLVGCGSMGSKIAVSLARSGVKNFVLVDDDLLLPENLVRHDLDWLEVGSHKVIGVAHRIQSVTADAIVSPRQYRLGGQGTAGVAESIIDTLSGCDLVIDATADGRVFNYVSAAAAAGTKPMLWAEIFGGGFGGLIARARPGVEPAPDVVRAYIDHWCRDQGGPIERPAAPYEGGEADPMIADDADVSVIAAHASRLAIDTLIGRQPSSFPYSAYFIGLSGRWIFTQPFDTRPIDLSGLTEPTRERLDPEVAKEEFVFVLGVLAKTADANTSSDTSSESA